MIPHTEHEQESDFFAVPELWKPSDFAANTNNLVIHNLEEFGRSCRDAPYECLAVCQDFDGRDVRSLAFLDEAKLALPDLETFQYGPLQDLSSSESSSISLDYEKPEGSIQEAEEEDVWAFAGNVDLTGCAQNLRTWERFYKRDIIEKTPYLSEAGPRALDAALVFGNDTATSGEHISKTRIVRSDPLLAALHQLGTGRASSFFTYDTSKQSFNCNFGGLRMSGYTEESFQSLTNAFIKHGNHFVTLSCFVERVYARNKPSATLVAIAATISSMTSMLLRYLGDSPTTLRSIIQLQAHFSKAGEILQYLSNLITKLPDSRSDAEILSVVYCYCEQLEYSKSWLRATFEYFLSRVSKPWRESVGSYIGLGIDKHMSCEISLLPYEKDKHEDENSRLKTFNFKPMPDFIAQEDCDKLLQTHNSLKMLQTSSSDHVLASIIKSRSTEPPELEWHFAWKHIERIEAKAKAYEANILEAMNRNYSYQDPSSTIDDVAKESNFSEPNPFAVPEDLLQLEIVSSNNIFEPSLPRLQQAAVTESLETFLDHVLKEDTSNDLRNEAFTLPLSVTPLLSFRPIISAQARLINIACLRLLFKEHNLSSHLRIQWQFHLFGDGVFASRLSQALFDPELESAERRKGHRRAGIMGLKLGSRSSWPPASSELRIALMGILSESYKSSLGVGSMDSRGGELPGGLSFAIRDISEAEMKRCTNPDSIEALDFLRIHYMAPTPLDAVITNSSMEKYDTIFKLLLRVKRMLFVVNQLARSTRSRGRNSDHIDSFSKRFSFEAHHFVTTISEYFFNIAVSSAWSSFERDIADIEEKLDKDETAYQVSSYEGIHQLQSRHGEVLDNMMFGLLLRKRQEQAITVLEEIFATILKFVKTIHETGSHDLHDVPPVDSKQDLYHKFRNNVRLFMVACKGLSYNRNGSTARTTIVSNGNNIIDQLLLRLGMNNHYS